jgi:hypothetical protein
MGVAATDWLDMLWGDRTDTPPARGFTQCVAATF